MRFHKMIIFNRKSRRFHLYLNGEQIGDDDTYADTYLDAERMINNFVYWLIVGVERHQIAMKAEAAMRLT